MWDRKRLCLSYPWFLKQTQQGWPGWCQLRTLLLDPFIACCLLELVPACSWIRSGDEIWTQALWNVRWYPSGIFTTVSFSPPGFPTSKYYHCKEISESASSSVSGFEPKIRQPRWFSLWWWVAVTEPAACLHTQAFMTSTPAGPACDVTPQVTLGTPQTPSLSFFPPSSYL